MPSWITNPPNYGESFARGASVGAQIGRNFLSAKIASDESARENAMLPLRQKLLDNQVRNTALDIKTKLDAQDDYLLNKEAFSKLSEAAKMISANAAWADPQSEARVWEIASEFPSVVATPQFKNVIQQFDVAGAAAIKAREAETRAIRAETDSDYKGQRLGLMQQQIENLKTKSDLDRDSRERMATEKNATTERVASMRLASQKMTQAMDILPRAMLAEYKAIVDVIADDASLTEAAKTRKMDEALTRLKEKRDNYDKSKNAPAGGSSKNEVRRSLKDGKVGIFDGNTKQFLRYAD